MVCTWGARASRKAGRHPCALCKLHAVPHTLVHCPPRTHTASPPPRALPNPTLTPPSLDVCCSRSPAIHNAALQHLGLNAVYVPLLVDDMAAFLGTFTGGRRAPLAAASRCHPLS